MPVTQLDFTRLNTPADSGGVLVEPCPGDMRAALETARSQAGRWDVRIVDLDLQAVRREVRQRVASVADDQLIIVTGHQPEFIHPGVWAKHVVAARLAEAAGGLALNLVVDTDSPKKTHLPVPTIRDGSLALETVSCSQLRPQWAYESIPRRGPDDVARFERDLRDLLGQRFDRSMLGVYCRALSRADPRADFVGQTVAARRAVEHCFGVDLVERRVSRCWLCPLLVDILACAPRFFDCYNAALAEYRRAQGIRGTQRPVPDLARDGPRIELPLWVAGAGQPRRRLFVEAENDRLRLYADREEIGVLPRDALNRWESAAASLGSLEGVLFRPRALTLTLWARMLLADLFIHGIGGAKYDRITDLLIRRYFGVAPPPMACVSATLRLDLSHHQAAAIRTRELTWKLRDLRFNPQRHLEAGPGIGRLIDARQRAVQRSIELRAAGGGHPAERRRVFQEIRSLSDRLLRSRPEVVRDLETRLHRARQQAAENEVARRRDYFFALFDRVALESLCAALPTVEEFRL